MTIVIAANATGEPEGQLATVELHFTEGVLAGLKLVGLAIWAVPEAPRRVSWPSRAYRFMEERREYALLRPASADASMTRLSEAILAQYKAEALAASDAADRAHEV